MEFERFVEALKVLSDETRIRILKLLEKSPAYLCQITAVLGFSPSTVSAHMVKLKHFGFVSEKREGTKVLFSLSEPEDENLRKVMASILEKAESFPSVLEDRQKFKESTLDRVCPPGGIVGKKKSRRGS
ncbi:ArsR family transcriptional regulator [Balnearium lithotrophicum]|uniref:ArsR family transcriptional regulator n=1 Tax=Balnearium lithotrophicum TaxID=223788 RepID=A0A521DBF0_9BACT|nr:metalloregulator ArsR/SmtB family transcription factor [Balnearium lithotrophicum]SMO68230.1 ArsR family transcriptional regulator [Balnearium lithotrophicum]